jgi:hypothetical protein
MENTVHLSAKNFISGQKGDALKVKQSYVSFVILTFAVLFFAPSNAQEIRLTQNGSARELGLPNVEPTAVSLPEFRFSLNATSCEMKALSEGALSEIFVREMVNDRTREYVKDHPDDPLFSQVLKASNCSLNDLDLDNVCTIQRDLEVQSAPDFCRDTLKFHSELTHGYRDLGVGEHALYFDAFERDILAVISGRPLEALPNSPFFHDRINELRPSQNLRDGDGSADPDLREQVEADLNKADQKIEKVEDRIEAKQQEIQHLEERIEDNNERLELAKERQDDGRVLKFEEENYRENDRLVEAKIEKLELEQELEELEFERRQIRDKLDDLRFVPLDQCDTEDCIMQEAALRREIFERDVEICTRFAGNPTRIDDRTLSSYETRFKRCDADLVLDYIDRRTAPEGRDQEGQETVDEATKVTEEELDKLVQKYGLGGCFFAGSTCVCEESVRATDLLALAKVERELEALEKSSELKSWWKRPVEGYPDYSRRVIEVAPSCERRKEQLEKGDSIASRGLNQNRIVNFGRPQFCAGSIDMFLDSMCELLGDNADINYFSGIYNRECVSNAISSFSKNLRSQIEADIMARQNDFLDKVRRAKGLESSGLSRVEDKESCEVVVQRDSKLMRELFIHNLMPPK